MKIITVPAACLVNHLRHLRTAEPVLGREKRLNSAGVSEDYFNVKTTLKLIDTRFKLLGSYFTLEP